MLVAEGSCEDWSVHWHLLNAELPGGGGGGILPALPLPALAAAQIDTDEDVGEELEVLAGGEDVLNPIAFGGGGGGGGGGGAAGGN
eukprot:250710-Chlamydomonas_euryale.AAC.1